MATSLSESEEYEEPESFLDDFEEAEEWLEDKLETERLRRRLSEDDERLCVRFECFLDSAAAFFNVISDTWRPGRNLLAPWAAAEVLDGVCLLWDLYFWVRLGERDADRLEYEDFELERERELRLLDEYELWLEREDLYF